MLGPMRISSPDGAPKEGQSSNGIELVIEPGNKDVGGAPVKRMLPSRLRAMVGPFTFLDHIGPVMVPPGYATDVRPHPHIGLATLSYSISGEMMHRDSTGVVQHIVPGDVNWMTAGRGVVHSERTPPEVRARGQKAHGVQLWVALPKKDEEIEPSFQHHPAATLPVLERSGARLRVLAGTAYGARSPVEVFSPLFYVEARLQAGGSLEVTDEHKERAVLVSEGQVTVGGRVLLAGQMAVLTPGARVMMQAEAPALVLMLGGAPMDGPRYLDWNFVSSSQERIQQARRDWKEGRFPKIPGDDVEFIPLPE
jgi:redox-sensitive bicupin YhaK (pirin superfamily)